MSRQQALVTKFYASIFVDENDKNCILHSIAFYLIALSLPLLLQKGKRGK